MVSKNLFSDLFLFFDLFVSLWRDPSELVSMMERNLDSSMKTLHVMCESRFYKGIDMKIFGEQRDKDWKSIYMLVEEYQKK
jgi:hypothetical protein